LREWRYNSTPFLPRHWMEGKSPWYPLDRRPGGRESRSGHCSEEKNSQPVKINVDSDLINQ
jgi:hypothetical protein